MSYLLALVPGKFASVMKFYLYVLSENENCVIQCASFLSSLPKTLRAECLFPGVTALSPSFAVEAMQYPFLSAVDTNLFYS